MTRSTSGGPQALWAIRWSHGSLTVLPARHLQDVRRIVAIRRGSTRDGWPAIDQVSVLGVEPVDSLELSVASRRQLNQPNYGCVRLGGTGISWTGPGSGLPPRGGDIGLAASPFANRARRVRACLWAYVWSPQELVVFAARDFETARLWAGRSAYGTKGEVDPQSIEPVENLELHLAPAENGFAPSCYRVWIEGLKVGWPPTEGQETPPAAGIRLPAPTYARTRAYASGQRKNAGEVGER